MTDIVLKDDRLNGGELKYQHLLGREFKLGTLDCYQMVRDMFKDNLNIQLNNYARPKFFWHNKDMNIYVDNYKNEGFELLRDPQPGDLRPFDCMLIAIPDPRSRDHVMTNHCAIYLMNNWVIHHRFGDTSKVEPYRGALRNLTTHIVRHKDVPDLRPKVASNVNLMDFILPHKRLELEEARRNADDTTNPE